MNSIGYKVLDMDMSTIYGDDMTYEMNKIYEMDENDLKICERGYHYYKRLKNTLAIFTFQKIKYIRYHGIYRNRIFEIEILGKEITDDKKIKYCTNRIKLVREISQEEVNQCIEEHLDELVHDKDSEVRIAVAQQGYGLDILVNDKNWRVRKVVARHGYGLDVLINDEDPDVRIEVAKQGYGLDKLINDESLYVREAVAEQGYGLDRLI